MHQFLPFIVIGLATGAVYGLAGMGVVLTFKTSGISSTSDTGRSWHWWRFFFFYLSTTSGRGPWPGLPLLVCVAVFAPLLGLVMEVLARSLYWRCQRDDKGRRHRRDHLDRRSDRAALAGESNPPTFTHFLSQSTVSMFGVNVTWEQIILFVFLIGGRRRPVFLLPLLCGSVFAMRGVVDNPSSGHDR